jgi:hypothetical protein
MPPDGRLKKRVDKKWRKGINLNLNDGWSDNTGETQKLLKEARG